MCQPLPTRRLTRNLQVLTTHHRKEVSHVLMYIPGLIIGASIGGVVVLTLILVLLLFMYRRLRKSRSDQSTQGTPQVVHPSKKNTFSHSCMKVLSTFKYSILATLWLLRTSCHLCANRLHMHRYSRPSQRDCQIVVPHLAKTTQSTLRLCKPATSSMTMVA